MKKKFFIIDWHHLIFRAFYAFPDLRKSNWELVNAIFWVASMTFNIIEKEKPDYIAFVFDMFKSFRHEDSTYKAQRKECPSELKPQIEIIYSMVKLMWIPIFALEWYEADDIAATIATINSKSEDIITYIVTWDMDAMQLICDNKIIVVVPNKWYKEPIYYNEWKLLEKYWFKPNDIITYKSLAGDTSDNIKWVEWIWEVWAKNLISKYWDLEWIYRNIDNIDWWIKDKLIKGKNQAFYCENMTKLKTDANFDFSLDICKYLWISENIVNFFKNNEFNSLLWRLNKLNGKKISQEQISLF